MRENNFLRHRSLSQRLQIVQKSSGEERLFDRDFNLFKLERNFRQAALSNLDLQL